MPPRACIQAVSPGRYRVGDWVASELDRVAESAGYLEQRPVAAGIVGLVQELMWRILVWPV